ncbi:Transposon Ty3-G Gag-Pol polyprotein [Araneus ventricosus]|uniref:RNA-directed DNA polymerase n=1 Tax=Araneus ventricosus TaxID=182803 RepID=A0A4Y2C637_ARAVE|nr:Transposon Ty3-G Gag-Pol polyprotein [Araneus ventricosus]
MKEKAPYDLREHFLDEWSIINSPIELAKKFEDYEDVRRTIKPKQFKSFAKESSNNHKYFRGQEHFHLGNNGNEKKCFQSKRTVYDKRIKQLTCSYCKGPGHYAVDCTKRRKDSKNNKSSSSPVQICSRISKERIKTRKITIGNKTFEALIDTGSSVTLIREDVSKGIIEQSKLSRDIVVLSGLGKYEVKTKGSFQREIELDGEKYSVTWHVVPTPYLEFQAVIGSDILEQAFVGFDKKGVYFRKHEDKVWFMHTQVYEARIEDEIEVKHVTNPRIRKELSELINNYIPKKTETTNVSMRIILKDDVPAYQPARRLSFPENQAVNKQIDEWLDQGIVRQRSSEYASPIVLVKKKDGTARLCVDYRKLNRKLVKDRFPLPLIEDVLDKLQDAKVYSTLDLKNGFFHVEVNEDCKHFTSFIVPDGQFEFNKVPFGLSTSPSVFQRYVYSIFRELMRKGIVIIYMDDLIIPAKDEDEGIEKLKKVFEVASKYGLEIKFKKCQFLRRRVEFLGHVVENGTVRPSVAKTIAVKKFPVPTTVKQVQSFLGLTGYFRKFIPAYSKIAKPLSDLIRSDNPFVFEQPQMEAFEKLKKLLTESPVLSIFQQGKTTELHTDASQQGYGAVLLQEAEDGKLHPVQYMSKKTTPAEEKYSSYELEVLAVVNALMKFRTYLMGNHFKIITDCSAFQRTMDKKDLVTRIARWALLLEEFDYEIVHRSGQRMQHVDALSRYPVAIITSDTLTARLKRAQQEDEYTQSLRSTIGSNNDSDFFDKNEILYKYVDGRELIVVPRDMQTEIIKLAHEKGHFSAAKTEGVVKQEFFIPNLSKQVQNVIVNCVPCILTNKKSGKKDGFLNIIPKEDVPLSTYHVDFIGPLPSTNKKYQHILTIVDAFTKFTWLYPVRSTSAEDALDKLKVQQKTFGNPKRIITDRGSAFTSKAFGVYCTNENIQHFQITTGVPRGNGQVERIHRTLIPVLTKLSIADSTKWFKFVDPLQRILNSTFNRSTKWSPFELLIGVTMRNKEDLHLRDLLMEEMMEELQEQRDELRQDAKKNIQKIQAENKRTYDRKCRNAPSYQRDGRRIPYNHRQRGFKNGTLIIREIDRRNDGGEYKCIARNSQGQRGERTLNIRVLTPPVIEPFHIPDAIEEGARSKLLCSVTKGDPPITIQWLKDGKTLPHDLEVTETILDEFSKALVFPRVELRHRGNYTCIARNMAASASFTASMVIHAPPRWTTEPPHTEAVLGSDVILNCVADGFPKPQILWKRAEDTLQSDYNTLLTDAHIHTLPNGSLSIRNVEKTDEGYYMCQATNGIGSGISTVISLNVRVPAHFKEEFMAETVRRGEKVVVKCQAFGDRPITITWKKDGQLLDKQAEKKLLATARQHCPCKFSYTLTDVGQFPMKTIKDGRKHLSIAAYSDSAKSGAIWVFEGRSNEQKFPDIITDDEEIDDACTSIEHGHAIFDEKLQEETAGSI